MIDEKCDMQNGQVANLWFYLAICNKVVSSTTANNGQHIKLPLHILMAIHMIVIKNGNYMQQWLIYSC